mgnify:FL=1
MYAKPKNMGEAISLLASGKWEIVAGGTDLFPSLNEGDVNFDILDISRLAELRGIQETQADWIIGALTTWADLEKATLPSAFNALLQAGREIGSLQIQNRGTLVGNLCNASPAADGVPPLLVLDAILDLVSTRGSRTIPLSKFIKGNRKTARRSDEIVKCVRIPKENCGGKSAFAKLGSRKYMVISIVMTAAKLEVCNQNLIRKSAISIGACSETAQRMPSIEAAIDGRSISEALKAINSEHIANLDPLSDIRASREYRFHAAQELIKRTLIGCQKIEDNYAN